VKLLHQRLDRHHETGLARNVIDQREPRAGRDALEDRGDDFLRATQRKRNGDDDCPRAAALRGRALLCEALGINAPAPESMIGSLAAVPLPPSPGAADAPPLSTDPIMATLYERHRIEVVASVWPKAPGRILRVSAQIYNQEAQYARLAGALQVALAAGA
jgi:hypothetical protein